jgi:hypothetical protein
MSSHHYKSPFVFFFIILLISLAGISYIYFHNYTPVANITWVQASLGIKTDRQACSPIPCYETYLLTNDGNVFHNDELEGKVPEGETEDIIKKAFGLYKSKACTPFYDDKVTQSYELKIDEETYEFGDERGCFEMQSIISTFHESINI